MPPLPQLGNLPSLVASIFSASPGSSWRNRLVIRVFIFRLFPTSGKQNVETGENQGCWKRLLRNRPGNSAFRPLGPIVGKNQSGRGAARPSGPQETKRAGFSVFLQFEGLQTRDPSGPSSTLRVLSKNTSSPRTNSFPGLNSRNPLPNFLQICAGSLPPTTASANLKPEAVLSGL